MDYKSYDDLVKDNGLLNKALDEALKVINCLWAERESLQIIVNTQEGLKRCDNGIRREHLDAVIRDIKEYAKLAADDIQMRHGLVLGTLCGFIDDEAVSAAVREAL